MVTSPFTFVNSHIATWAAYCLSRFEHSDAQPLFRFFFRLSNGANKSRETPPYLSRASYLGVPAQVKAQAKAVEGDRTWLIEISLAAGTKV